MSKRRFFGTDGIRGEVGKDPMNADFALRLASAAARVLVPTGGTVLIGKDTRLSGYMFESALEAGFVAAGADVYAVDRDRRTPLHWAAEKGAEGCLTFLLDQR